MDKNEKFIFDLIESQSLSFVGSIDEDGFPNIRAMLRPRKYEKNIIYFSTNKVKQFLKSPKACVYFCNPSTFQGVLLVGNMEVVTTTEFKQMLWKDGDEIYYSKGVNDPDYCVLRFTIIKGRKYDDFKSSEFKTNRTR